ncbi:Uncharacterised protein [Klebsiella pneumoniae]|uniref:Uncharacterized protein n=1 Tax=Klebsiella pneumoniae TaxID=573 RepID=A0A2X3F515_KLEPN|nr:Uncharacterised protein [Klebsiella pneumoniae]
MPRQPKVVQFQRLIPPQKLLRLNLVRWKPPKAWLKMQSLLRVQQIAPKLRQKSRNLVLMLILMSLLHKPRSTLALKRGVISLFARPFQRNGLMNMRTSTV